MPYRLACAGWHIALGATWDLRAGVAQQPEAFYPDDKQWQQQKQKQKQEQKQWRWQQ